ncbi:MAG: hypothetical protein ACLT8C_05005 [Akkermansia muciniphila]
MTAAVRIIARHDKAKEAVHKQKEDEYGKRYPSPAGFLLPAGQGQFKTGIFKRRPLLGGRISEGTHIARSLYYRAFLPSMIFNASPAFSRRKFFPLTNTGHRLQPITLLSNQRTVKIHEKLLTINHFFILPPPALLLFP